MRLLERDSGGSRAPPMAVRLVLQAGFAAEDAGGVVFREGTSHIFRDAAGHLLEDTPANRELIQSAVGDAFKVGERTLPRAGGTLTQYRRLLDDGRQVWAEVRNGSEITNGGVNEVPRP